MCIRDRLKVLKNDETQALLLRAKQGDMKAREELIAGNLRLVLSVIQRFANLSLIHIYSMMRNQCQQIAC